MAEESITSFPLRKSPSNIGKSVASEEFRTEFSSSVHFGHVRILAAPRSLLGEIPNFIQLTKEAFPDGY